MENWTKEEQEFKQLQNGWNKTEPKKTQVVKQEPPKQVAIADNRAIYMKKLGNNEGLIKQAFLNETLAMDIARSSKLDLTNQFVQKALSNCVIEATINGLSLSKQLGLAYIYPFEITLKNGNKLLLPSFIPGYKGYIQLAQRTGIVKTINMFEIYEGDKLSRNHTTGDWYVRKFAKLSERGRIIGYFAVFQTVTGFSKTEFMTTQEVIDHASKYSKSFNQKTKTWSIAPFDDMAKKTVFRKLKKYIPVTPEFMPLINAIQKDYSIIDENEKLIYPDNPSQDILDIENERPLTDEEKKVLEEVLND